MRSDGGPIVCVLGVAYAISVLGRPAVSRERIALRKRLFAHSALDDGDWLSRYLVAWSEGGAHITRSGALPMGFCVLASSAALILFAVAAITNSLAWRERRRRFADRSLLTEDEWFDRFFPESTESRCALAELLNELGKETGVEWTRFRPDDTFGRSFLFNQKLILWGNDIDGFWCAYESWLKKHRIPPALVRGPEVDSLRAFLEAMEHALRQCRPGAADSNSATSHGIANTAGQ